MRPDWLPSTPTREAPPHVGDRSRVAAGCGHRGHAVLDLGPLPGVRVRVASEPLVSLVSLVLAALGGRSHGVASEWIHRIRRDLPADAANAIRPIIDQPATLLPDCLSPVGLQQLPITDRLDQIAQTSAEALWLGVIGVHRSARPPRPWHPALRRPGRWVGLYVSALASAWRSFAPVWERTAELRARESDRVGAAVVTGGLEPLLCGLSRRIHVADDGLCLPHPLPRQAHLGGRTLVLAPLATAPGGLAYNLDHPEVVWLGYPIPGLGRLAAGSHGDARDPLAALIGPVRAAILRHLGRPATMGSLAERLDTAASTANYHCVRLAAAGLVERKRDGREMYVRRSARGDALIGLLA